jgi:phosphatidylinositol-3-phosphatase
VQIRFVLPLILVAGCAGLEKPSVQHRTTAQTPPASLSATPTAIQEGQAPTLTWRTTNANDVTIDGTGIVPPNGPRHVPSGSPPSYLAAERDDGTQEAMAQVSGNAPTSPAHVILIIEENRSFSTVYPYGMPWLSALGDAYGIATNYFSDEPGSMLDYLWLSSGSGEHAFGCGGWGCSNIITSDNIFRELDKSGMSWKVYADSLPYVGYMGIQSGEYVKRHNPAPWYSNVAYHPAKQKNMVPFTQFAKDLAAHHLPDYSLIVPNLLHDAHDGTVAMADRWLKQYISPVLSSPYFTLGGNGVMFITFDNGDSDKQGQVFTAVIGADVIHGVKVNTAFRHENALRTIMELLGLKHYPGASRTAAPMREFFK